VKKRMSKSSKKKKLSNKMPSTIKYEQNNIENKSKKYLNPLIRNSHCYTGNKAREQFLIII
jgi:hypothetical protein